MKASCGKVGLGAFSRVPPQHPPLPGAPKPFRPRHVSSLSSSLSSFMGGMHFYYATVTACR